MRNYDKVAGFVFASALAISLMAAAQTSSSSSPPAPSQAGSQSGGSSSGSSTAGAQQPNSPAGQASPTQPSSARPGSAAQGDPDDDLHLTDAQRQQLQPIIENEMKQIDAVRSDTSMTVDQKRAKVQQIREAEFPKIQAILTPEQRKKLDQLRQKAQQGTKAGSSPNSPQQPPPK